MALPSNSKFLTDELRRQAARVLPKEYSVLTRDKIISLIPKTAENVPDPVPYPNEYRDSKNAFDAEYKKMQSAETARNIFYATGGALLLSGIAVHIWF